MKFIFYKSLNEDKIIYQLMKLSQGDISVEKELLGNLFEKSYELGLDGNLVKSYICYLIACDENVFSLTAESAGLEMDETLKEFAIQDMRHLLEMLKLSTVQIELKNKRQLSDEEYLEDLIFEEMTEHELLNVLIKYYETHGAGVMNQYKAFKWDRTTGLIGIKNCDSIRLEHLLGCDYQKKALIENTEKFLEGKEANNVLLFGDSGTGKSSSIKALLNTYYRDGLRLVELSKSDFIDFNKILKSLKQRGLKFIFFLDDLSFEEFETEYKYMKALIEGGVEVKPNNILIYATSNRRHLIRETWEERQGQDVHISDTRQEKLSLADRFGLSLTFTSPSQNAYLEIVLDLAKRYKINLPENILREEAIKWELIHGGRSGRVAKQFIQSLN